MALQRYYLRSNGKQIGPLGQAEILHLWEAGQIESGAKISEFSVYDLPKKGESLEGSEIFKQMESLKHRAQVPPSLILFELQEQLEELTREARKVKWAVRWGFLALIGPPLVWVLLRAADVVN